MGIFDVFTGQPAKDAADKNKQLLEDAQKGIYDRTQGAKGLASGFLDTGYDQAGRDLGTGYGTASGAINAGAGGALGYLDQGAQGAFGQLDRARGDLTANGGAYVPLSNLAGDYGRGAGLYADALGVNGAQGNARARSAFTTDPGYQFALDTGLDSINRAANARGMANSGNTDIDALKFGTGLANQNYQQWLTNLAPYNNLQLSATQGAAAGNAGINQGLAGIDQAAANVFTTAGQNRAGVATGQGTSLADIANRYYAGLAGNDTARGAALAGNETNANNAITNSDLNLVPKIGQTYKDAADAEMAGSGNLWNLGLNAAKLGAGIYGGANGWFSGAGGTGGGSANPFAMGFASPNQRG